MDVEGLGTFKEREGQPLIHLVQVQEEPNCVRPNTSLVRLVFSHNATRIKSQQFILLIK